MRALFPWLLFAPLLTTTLALPLWQLTRWPWAGWLAGIAGLVSAVVIAVAFVANWRRGR